MKKTVMIKPTLKQRSWMCVCLRVEVRVRGPYTVVVCIRRKADQAQAQGYTDTSYSFIHLLILHLFKKDMEENICDIKRF